MHRKIGLVIFSCFIFSMSHGQVMYNCLECNLPEARKISEDMWHIQDMRFYCFLHGFSLSKCQNNLEYIQFANPLLFDMLLKNPAALLNMLKKYPELYTAALHKQFQTPLLDFNINRVIYVLDSAYPKSRIKKQVLDDLDAIDVDERGYPR